MNKLVRSYIVNVLYLGLVGWAVVALYSFVAQCAAILKHPEPPWEASMNIMPLFLLILVGLLFTYMNRKNKKNKLTYWMFPLFFPEADEREKMITAKACRSAFIATWISIPICACILPVYPFLNDYLPEYPIYLLLFVVFLQVTTFYVSLYRNRI
ncbi:hypothetical protein ACFDTO_27840 [Microbacteriaceae bacterium 4G12]